jgi:hypothetical protein
MRIDLDKIDINSFVGICDDNDRVYSLCYYTDDDLKHCKTLVFYTFNSVLKFIKRADIPQYKIRYFEYF